MSTSAESPVRLRAVAYDDPVAEYLVERVQQEYIVRYGGRDGAAVEPADFGPPRGTFLVAEVDGVPAACGAWRVHEDGIVEIKRLYVEPGFRRRGLAQLVMQALEESAARAGHRAVLLNTGLRQPEALALYARLGYRDVPGYGIYAESPDARFLGKELVGEDFRGDDLLRPVADEEVRLWGS
jgi:GNAT superfamily N-acetyltransferase